MINHCKTRLSKALKKSSTPNYHMKLQVHRLAHHKSVADFLVLTTHYNYVIECKECLKNTFSFGRLTQEDNLVDYHQALNRNESFVCILFWKGYMNKSYMFMIPIEKYLEVKQSIGKKSINIDECKEKFDNCLLSIEKSQVNINKFFKEMEYKFHSYRKQTRKEMLDL